MEEIKKLLETREIQLKKLKKEKENALISVPKGSLRICSHNNRTQYYFRDDPKDFSGVYIKGKDFPLVQKLAQKDYDKKVLSAVEKELKAIQKYLSNYPEKNAEQIYESLHKERQKLILPIIDSEERFCKRWEAIEYEGKGFRENTPELYTSKGERVRSKSELIIADLLNKEGIPYRYEYPIQIHGIGKIYPDFTVLNLRLRKEFYWEHFGMMDNSEYAENALQKIAVYEQNGIFPGENLILTYETIKNPINQKVIMLMMERYLK